MSVTKSKLIIGLGMIILISSKLLFAETSAINDQKNARGDSYNSTRKNSYGSSGRKVSGRYANSKRGNRMNEMQWMTALYSDLGHGNLSEAEKNTMQNIYNESLTIHAMRTAMQQVFTANLAARQEANQASSQVDSANSEYTQKTDIGRKERSSRTSNEQTILSYLAESYDTELSSSISSTENTNAFADIAYTELLPKNATVLEKYIQQLQTAYTEADDEDIQATYYILQARAIRALSRTTQAMISEGLSPRANSLGLLNTNNQDVIAHNSEILSLASMPQSLLYGRKFGNFRDGSLRKTTTSRNNKDSKYNYR